MQEKNNQPLITIVTVNYKTSDFIDLMLYSFKKLTKNSYKVLICDNYSNDSEIVKLAKVVQKYDNVEVMFRKQTQFGSIDHSEAMDLLISRSKSKYTVLMDSDCVVLIKDWDQLMINKLTNNVKIIGSCEPYNRQKNINRIAKDFPLPFTTMIETEVYQNLNLSCMPRDISKGEDTCWLWESSYKNRNYDYFNIYPQSTRDTNIPLFNNIIGCDVYFLDNELFSSHFGRGSSLGSAKYKNWYYKYIPLLSSYVRNNVGVKQKNKWIQICYKIINEKSK